jgi:hypothetical protein
MQWLINSQDFLFPVRYISLAGKLFATAQTIKSIEELKQFRNYCILGFKKEDGERWKVTLMKLLPNGCGYKILQIEHFYSWLPCYITMTSRIRAEDRGHPASLTKFNVL